MPAGLALLQQDDFSAGMFTSVAPHLIPPSGVSSILNGLLDEDGSVYRRGGSAYASTAFAAGGLTWVWHGYLKVGARTVFAADGSFGVLDGTTPVDIGGPGLTRAVRAPVVGGMLFIPGGYIYGGSLKAADYVATSVDLTVGSTIVTGTGFSANIDPGMIFVAGPTARAYVVASVDSDTQLTIADAYFDSSTTVASLTFRRLVPPGIGQVYPVSNIYATVAERLVTIDGSRIRFSRARSELGALQTHIFDPTDYHELPEGAVGLGAEAIRDLLVVFSTDGIWTINNMTFDLTDAAGNVQQSMQRTSQDVLLASPAGVSSYGGSLVVPARNAVYLVDGVNPPVSVSESIKPTYAAYAATDAVTGGAVYNDHYLLSVSNGLALVCRLDRPVRMRNRTVFPWSFVVGHAGATAFAVTSDIPSRLLGAGGTDGRVLSLGAMFNPTSGNKNDADGSTHTFSVTTRDFPTGTGNVNTVRRIRVRYEMTDAATDNPGITAAYAPGTNTFTTLTDEAPEDIGVNKYTWNLQADARYFRVRLQSTDPAARLTLRSVEIAVRQSFKDR